MKVSFLFLIYLTFIISSCFYRDINIVTLSKTTVTNSPSTEIINLQNPNKTTSDQNEIYDPFKISEEFEPKVLDLIIDDQSRKRKIPILIYCPQVDNPVPTLIFSHGLGGSRNTNKYLGLHWAKRGYIAVFLQHIGSDESVWKNKSRIDALADMRKAANAENLLLRVKDVSILIDQLEKWNIEEGHVLKNRFDLKKIGMSGYSFGAVTTQAVSGQNFGNFIIQTDSRIKASTILSPNIPNLMSPEIAFGKVKIPWLLMTGTKDKSLINNSDAASRLKVFPALPAGDKYELVLNKAEHSAFSDKKLPGDKEARNPNHHKSILAISTSFWDAYLMDNTNAKNWLNGDGPRSILEKEDRWQKK